MHEIIRTAPAATSHKQYQLVVFSPAPPALPATESDGHKSSSSRHQMNLMERESQKEPRLNFLRDKFCQMCHDKCIRWHASVNLCLISSLLLNWIKIDCDEKRSGMPQTNCIQNLNVYNSYQFQCHLIVSPWAPVALQVQSLVSLD